MLRRTILIAFTAILVSLALSSKAQAWGCYHAGYTHYSPYTGVHHYGYTTAHTGGYGGYGGAHYGYHYGSTGYGGGYHYGYHYGGYGGYGGYHYGYHRAW